jgi:hypothetical protein
MDGVSPLSFRGMIASSSRFALRASVGIRLPLRALPWMGNWAIEIRISRSVGMIFRSHSDTPNFFEVDCIAKLGVNARGRVPVDLKARKGVKLGYGVPLSLRMADLRD